MENLYIQIENGQTIDHPLTEENILQNYGSIPENFEPFTRASLPTLNEFQVFEIEKTTYQKVNNVWTDVWSVRDMTDSEKAEKIKNNYLSVWNANPQVSNWSTWTYDYVTQKMQPPIPRPEPDQTKINAGIKTVWCGADNNWKDTPPKPDDAKEYNFDFFEWNWKEVTNV